MILVQKLLWITMIWMMKNFKSFVDRNYMHCLGKNVFQNFCSILLITLEDWGDSPSLLIDLKKIWILSFCVIMLKELVEFLNVSINLWSRNLLKDLNLLFRHIFSHRMNNFWRNLIKIGQKCFSQDSNCSKEEVSFI